MNKTKKDKYLRKNRRISNKNKNKKNKTRKVQRGGEDGDTAVDAGRNPLAIGTGAPIIQNQPTISSLTGEKKDVQTRQPLTQEEFKKKLEKERAEEAAQAQLEKEKAAAEAEKKAAPAPAPEATPATTRPFKSTNMGFDFGGPIQPSTKPEAAASPSAEPEAAASPSTKPKAAPATTLSEAVPAKAETNEERDAQLKQRADEQNKRKQESNPQVVALANSPSNIMKSFFLNLFESKKKELPTALAIDNLTKNISTIIDENDKNLDIVNKVGDAIREHIKDILTKENLSDLTDDDRRILIVLIGDLARVGEIAQKIANSSSELAYAGTTDGNLDALKHQSRYNQGFGGKRNAGIAKKPTPSSTKQQSPSESAKPKNGLQKFTDLFSRKNKKPAEPTAEPPKTEPAASAAEPPKTEPAATPASATEPAPPEPPKTESAATTEPATPEPISQSGGNKTRKNRQYVREIKENRNELFNKEMEIINSIRNFKHGRTDNDNTKKQFIKAVKRS